MIGEIKAAIIKHTGDRETDSNFTEVRRVIEDLIKKWFTIGKFIETNLAAGDNRVYHGMGRRYSGLIFLKRQSAAVLYEKEDNTNPKEYITINASAGLNGVKFYIF